MNIPFILDLAIGLIFVYLILSLLASEIQELITTLLQWRAEHLKKSIEVMMGGTKESEESRKARLLANALYAHPLIKDLNQEAKGALAQGFRKISSGLFKIYQKMTNTENVFGENEGGPSYIRPDFFAVTLLDILGIDKISHALSIARVEKFKQEQLKEIVSLSKTASLSEVNAGIFTKELRRCGQNFNELVTQYSQEEITLAMFVELMEERFRLFVDNSRLAFAAEGEGESLEFLLERISAIAKRIYGEAGKKVLLKNLKPEPREIMASLPRYREVYLEIQEIFEDKNSPAYQGIEAAFKELEKVIDLLPESLKESLRVLAKRAQQKNEGVQDTLNTFQQEIETWFDRSMERSSGVYKRNARGIAILIGCLVAAIANADTIYIVSSLSKDPVLRATVTQNAQSIVNAQPIRDPRELEGVKAELRKSLQDISLPIGWSEITVKEQRIQNRHWRVPFVKQLAGWLISGIAISMGSSFWFDLMGKIVNVRNAGKGSDSRDEHSSRSV
ncbi:hypothetical protein NG796_15540 [Laspinema sp. A4]|uniref:hypothetical protein n=1 Tax=Laspinema sp. D2d TaxID=2953686 RepID=UPI0021BACCF3|nr:hypothetical protein [Laspinema sp. D2d]MCT7984711.1 hypothetical protein [Laspinema sp. D2d]